MAILVVLRRVLAGIVSSLKGFLVNTVLFSLDFLLALYNLITPNRAVGHVVQPGNPGHGGKWPAYVPPGEGDSRCSCPALNAMANHGLLPHDGKNITFTEMTSTIRRVYNFSPTFCYYVPNYIATALSRDYNTDRLDLSDIDAHNCIQHDASLTRVDDYFDPDQGKIAGALVEEVLSSGTGPDGNLTKADLSRLLGKRRVEAKQRNPKYSMSFIHKMFGSSKCVLHINLPCVWGCVENIELTSASLFSASTLLTIYGGRVKDLRPILGEERIPEGWEPRIRHRMGLTLFEFNFTVLPVELNIKEEVDGSIARAGQERYLVASPEPDADQKA
ncbi:Cloroperoxidase [Cubamyces menziesii]|uniref:Heme-thiolate peroxidase n=1 Tax=Trametes cubensis TaxID=1111947 RepID=A0AAD7XCJ9_9APHY|nr:Cloroperoxidase [Cubamyces menziesii]KAJ8475437.1 heme-thiolate peroxidase [Trametes cubensis]